VVPLGLALMLIFLESRRPWLIAFLAISGVGVILQIYFLNDNYAFYVLRRYIGYLLILGVLQEILAKDYNTRTRFLYVAWAGIVIPALILPPNGLYFYIPRAILFGLCVWYLPKAFASRNIIHLGFGIMSIWHLVSDAIKLLQSAQQIVAIQQMLDPWVPKAVYVAVFSMALYELIKGTSNSPLKYATDNGQTVDYNDFSSKIEDEDNVIQFPIKEHPGLAAIRQEFGEEIGLEELEMVFLAVAKTAEIHHKELLNEEDLQILLDLPRQDISPFLETHSIKKIYITEDNWVVEKAAVFVALGIGT